MIITYKYFVLNRHSKSCKGDNCSYYFIVYPGGDLARNLFGIQKHEKKSKTTSIG